MQIIIGILFVLVVIQAAILVFQRKKIKELIYQNEKSQLLLTVIKMASGNVDIEKTLAKINTLVLQSYNIKYSTVFLMEGDNLKVAVTNVEDIYRENLLEIRSNEMIDRIMKACKTKILNFSGKGFLNYPTARERRIRTCFILPLIRNEHLYGYWMMEEEDPDFFNRTNMTESDNFVILSNQISKVIAVSSALTNWKVKATTDNLTGAYNREFLWEYLRSLIDRKAECFDGPFSIVLFDLDHFKYINDTYGHNFGDQVLIGCSKVAKSLIGEEDHFFRFGGEEFIIILDNMDIEQTRFKMEALRKKLENNLYQYNKENIKVTCSMGILNISTEAEFRNLLEHKETEIALIEMADKALYYSKENGRNRITFYSADLLLKPHKKLHRNIG